MWDDHLGTWVGVAFLAGTIALLSGSGCAGGAELGEPGELGDDQGDEAAAELEQPQAVDCRPVRTEPCGNPWNDRACFHVPPECAVRANSTAPAP